MKKETETIRQTLIGKTLRISQKTTTGTRIQRKTVVSERWEDFVRMYDVQIDDNTETVPVLADAYDKIFLKQVTLTANYRGKPISNIGKQMPNPFRNK